MIYVLKALYMFVLPPGLFIVLMLAVSVWLLYRHQSKIAWVLLGFTALLYLVSIPPVGESALRSLESRYEPPAAINGDVYVVLTGGAVTGTPDASGPHDQSSLSQTTMSRMAAVVELYARKKLPILISGGQVYENSGNEGQISKRALIAMGVPQTDILLEDRSRTTQENAVNSAQMLREHGFQHPILVTSASHMVRAVKHFRTQQVTVTPYPVAYMASRGAGWSARQLLPSSIAMDDLALAMKEYLGMLQP
ncbi:YdcF family protein [Paenibacillus cremeus]|uniref:YdcF family protein n=1 Tax=Paenibacillus cremeus TaxID=2163881 RepID=A0A559K6D0_9BACL|nr:YdcF family protein [Paenibacillus cremeus]TVY07684.1 YdcF family protein [Paenibacillus cremeus]